MNVSKGRANFLLAYIGDYHSHKMNYLLLGLGFQVVFLVANIAREKYIALNTLTNQSFASPSPLNEDDNRLRSQQLKNSDRVKVVIFDSTNTTINTCALVNL